MDGKNHVTISMPSWDDPAPTLVYPTTVFRPPNFINRKDVAKSFDRNYRCQHLEIQHLTELQDSTLIRVGDKFESLESFREHLYANSKCWGVYYTCHLAKYMETTSLTFKCRFFQKQKKNYTTQNLRTHKKKSTNCPSFIKLYTEPDSSTLVVTEVCHHHDHPISDEEFAKLSHAKFLPPYIKDEFLDLISIGVPTQHIQKYFESLTDRTISLKIIRSYRHRLQRRMLPQRNISDERLHFLNVKKALLETTYGIVTTPKQKSPDPQNVPRIRKNKKTTAVKRAVSVSYPMYNINQNVIAEGNMHNPYETNHIEKKRIAAPKKCKPKNIQINTHSKEQDTEISQSISTTADIDEWPSEAKRKKYNEDTNVNNTISIQSYDRFTNEFQQLELMLMNQNNDDHYEATQESISENPEKIQCYELFQTDNNDTYFQDSFYNDHCYISAPRDIYEITPICTSSDPTVEASLRSEQVPITFAQGVNIIQVNQKGSKKKVINRKEDKQHKRDKLNITKNKKEEESNGACTKITSGRSRLETRLETLSQDEETLQCVQNLRESAALAEWNPWYAEYYRQTVNSNPSIPVIAELESDKTNIQDTDNTHEYSNHVQEYNTDKFCDIFHNVIINTGDDTIIDTVNQNDKENNGDDRNAAVEQFANFKEREVSQLVKDTCITDYNISVLKADIQEVLKAADKVIAKRKYKTDGSKGSQNIHTFIDKYNIAEHMLDPEISKCLDGYANETNDSILSILHEIYKGSGGFEIEQENVMGRKFAKLVYVKKDIPEKNCETDDLNLIIRLKEHLEKATNELTNLNLLNQNNEIEISQREDLKNKELRNTLSTFHSERKELENKLLQFNAMFERELALEANINRDTETEKNELVSDSKRWLAGNMMKLQIEGLEKEVANLTNIKAGLISDIVLLRNEVEEVNLMKNNLIDEKIRQLNKISQEINSALENNILLQEKIKIIEELNFIRDQTKKARYEFNKMLRNRISAQDKLKLISNEKNKAQTELNSIQNSVKELHNQRTQTRQELHLIRLQINAFEKVMETARSMLHEIRDEATNSIADVNSARTRRDQSNKKSEDIINPVWIENVNMLTTNTPKYESGRLMTTKPFLISFTPKPDAESIPSKSKNIQKNANLEKRKISEAYNQKDQYSKQSDVLQKLIADFKNDVFGLIDANSVLNIKSYSKIIKKCPDAKNTRNLKINSTVFLESDNSVHSEAGIYDTEKEDTRKFIVEAYDNTENIEIDDDDPDRTTVKSEVNTVQDDSEKNNEIDEPFENFDNECDNYTTINTRYRNYQLSKQIEDKHLYNSDVIMTDKMKTQVKSSNLLVVNDTITYITDSFRSINSAKIFHQTDESHQNYI